MPPESETLTTVFVTTKFMAYHRWKDAPPEVSFLRYWHRHLFHVRVDVPVSHGNRDVEFFTLKEKLQQHLRDVWEGTRFEFSCEQIADALLAKFDAFKVEVSEDGENGATVYRKLLRVQEVKAPYMGGKSSVQEEILAQLKRHLTLGGASASPLTETLTAEAAKPASPKAPDVVVDKRLEEVLKVRKEVFFGLEVEGPNKGWPTIFVPGSCPPKAVVDAWNDVVHECNLRGFKIPDFQVYLGAGNDRKIRLDTLELAKWLFKPSRTVIEVTKVSDVWDPEIRPGMLKFVNEGGTIVTLSPTDYAYYRGTGQVWLKIVLPDQKKLKVVTHAGRYESSLVDDEYGKDVTDAATFVGRVATMVLDDAR